MGAWEEYLANQANIDGVQMTWNLWPHSRIDAQKLVVPVATFFTPLKVQIKKPDEMLHSNLQLDEI